MFTTLLVVVGALFVAVIGRALLDWPLGAAQETEEHGADDGYSMITAIVLACS